MIACIHVIAGIHFDRRHHAALSFLTTPSSPVILSEESAYQCGFAIEGPCVPRAPATTITTTTYTHHSAAPSVRAHRRAVRDYTYLVYILTNASRRSLYIGVTNALKVRVKQHKEKEHDGFTSKYNVDRLVYYEAFQYIHAAIAREEATQGLDPRQETGTHRPSQPAVPRSFCRVV